MNEIENKKVELGRTLFDACAKKHAKAWCLPLLTLRELYLSHPVLHLGRAVSGSRFLEKMLTADSL